MLTDADIEKIRAIIREELDRPRHFTMRNETCPDPSRVISAFSDPRSTKRPEPAE